MVRLRTETPTRYPYRVPAARRRAGSKVPAGAKKVPAGVAGTAVADSSTGGPGTGHIEAAGSCGVADARWLRAAALAEAVTGHLSADAVV